jgi:hypothetical protein
MLPVPFLDVFVTARIHLQVDPSSRSVIVAAYLSHVTLVTLSPSAKLETSGVGARVQFCGQRSPLLMQVLATPTVLAPDRRNKVGTSQLDMQELAGLTVPTPARTVEKTTDVFPTDDLALM